MTTCTPRAAWLNLLRRLHFYIGLFVGPFIFVAALTGTLYVATPQLENLFYADTLYGAASGERHSLAEQIALAEQVTGGHLRLHAVRPGLANAETTRVMFADPALGVSEHRAIFIDPVTLAVKGDHTAPAAFCRYDKLLTMHIARCCLATPGGYTANWRHPGCGWRRWAVLCCGFILARNVA